MCTCSAEGGIANEAESTGSSIAACCRIGFEVLFPLPRGWQLERKRRGLCGNDRLGG